MDYYVLQVRTGGEDDFIQRYERSCFAPKGRLFLPKRALLVRRAGKVSRKELPVFPGYVFLETERVDEETRWQIRHIEGFYRFLKNSGNNPTPLSDKDRALLHHFISFGKRADISKVTFDENDRIVVLEGPLKGLEGKIIKVDRRKSRAKVILDLYEKSFPIDFGFEEVKKVGQGGGASHVVT